MLVLLIGLSLAGPPEGVDLEDTARWEDGVDAMLDGPAGCWEVVGRATWNHNFGRFYTTRGDAAFVGKLVDGVWTDFAVHPMGEVRKEYRKSEKTVYDGEQRFFPLLGRVERPEADEDEAESGRRRRRRKRDDNENADERVVSDAQSDDVALNALRESLDELSEQVEYSWSEWDDEREEVVLERVVPLKKAGNSEARVRAAFPQGGAVPTRMTVTFPDSFLVKTTPPARIQDAVVQLRGRAVEGQVFPKAEAFSVGIGVLGFSFRMAQTIRYTEVQPCASPPTLEDGEEAPGSGPDDEAASQPSGEAP